MVGILRSLLPIAIMYEFFDFLPPQIRLTIPQFRVIGDHVEFEVAIFAKDASWTISRRFRQFRDLHVAMVQR